MGTWQLPKLPQVPLEEHLIQPHLVAHLLPPGLRIPGVAQHRDLGEPEPVRGHEPLATLGVVQATGVLPDLDGQDLEYVERPERL